MQILRVFSVSGPPHSFHPMTTMVMRVMLIRDCNVESVNENFGKNDESDDDTVTRKVFSPHNLGTPGSPGVKGPSS